MLVRLSARLLNRPLAVNKYRHMATFNPSFVSWMVLHLRRPMRSIDTLQVVATIRYLSKLSQSQPIFFGTFDVSCLNDVVKGGSVEK